jgi:hypothetical protein
MYTSAFLSRERTASSRRLLVAAVSHTMNMQPSLVAEALTNSMSIFTNNSASITPIQSYGATLSTIQKLREQADGWGATEKIELMHHNDAIAA